MYLYQTASHLNPEDWNLNVFTVVKYSACICFMIVYVSDEAFILNIISFIKDTQNMNNKNKHQTLWPQSCESTIPTDQPPLVNKVRTNFSR
jgi:hypothetical protein